MYKKFYIDTLKVRARVLDQAYQNGVWDGLSANTYCRRKRTLDSITNIIQEIVITDIKKITFQESAKETYIYLDKDVHQWQVLSDIYQKGLTGHYIGYSNQS